MSTNTKLFGRNEQDVLRNPPQVDSSYDILEAPNAPPKKNCTGSTNCIPKCFAEKGNRGFPGNAGQTGPQGTFYLVL